ncbi:hypothetical protein [Psychromonas sp. MME2]|uniref:hypothetical protein n=1 Tax=unclassified Psychromonas TaxID=2614957 RepID=UPI00339C6A4B
MFIESLLLLLSFISIIFGNLFTTNPKLYIQKVEFILFKKLQFLLIAIGLIGMICMLLPYPIDSLISQDAIRSLLTELEEVVNKYFVQFIVFNFVFDGILYKTLSLARESIKS